uniref:Expressed protein n=1 Tax=Arabidopsis thaliana TaxID=3702 RepID=Q8S8R8_ARATH|nr:Expressed protein [Arabidopsis thaliana]AAM63362.1 unknown [Arabidopsis thaliana]
MVVIPENCRGVPENGGGFVRLKAKISIKENVLKPAKVTIGSNPFSTVTKRVRWTRFVFERVMQSKEVDGFLLQLSQKIGSDPMVDDFEEPKLFTCLDDLGFGI